MNAQEFYKAKSPYLWNSDKEQDDEGFYGKDDMIRFAQEYHESLNNTNDIDGIIERPYWLTDYDNDYSVELYKENKLEAVKYLTRLAKGRKERPLRWARDYLVASL